jgi:hypothetical protein
MTDRAARERELRERQANFLRRREELERHLAALEALLSDGSTAEVASPAEGSPAAGQTSARATRCTRWT